MKKNLKWTGTNYEIADRIRPEVRIWGNEQFENIYYSALATYDIFEKQHYEGYAGIGTFVFDQFNDFSTDYRLIIPVGTNIYPLENKQFGFHIEISPMVGDGGNFLLSSWGIRYRFNSNSSN